MNNNYTKSYKSPKKRTVKIKRKKKTKPKAPTFFQSPRRKGLKLT